MEKMTKSNLEKLISRSLSRDQIKVAKKALNRFLNKGRDECGKDFEKTRLKLVQICYEEKTPQKRWAKARDLLVENIGTQIPVKSTFSYHLRKKLQKKLGNQTTPLDENPSNYNILYMILDNSSYVYECVKLVAIFNTFSNPEKLLPRNVKLFFSEKLDFEAWNFRYESMRIHIQPKSGEKKTIDIPEDIYNKFKVPCSLLEYTGEDGKEHSVVRQDSFYNRFKEKYTDIVRTFKLSLNHKPSQILSVLETEFQRKFLKTLIMKEFTNWKWKQELVPLMERGAIIEKIIEPNNIKAEEIEDFSIERNPLWEPDKPYLNTNAMSFELADHVIKKLTLSERRILLLQASSMINYGIFEIPSFGEIVNSWRENHNEKELRSLSRIINKTFSRSEMKLKETANTYWGIYIDVEKLIQGGLTKKQAYKRLAVKYHNMKSSTICARYKEKAVEAKASNLDVQDIISKYGLYECEELVPDSLQVKDSH